MVWIVENQRTGELLADKAKVAASFFKRARGLLGRSRLEEGEALILYPCSSVHMFGMRFPLDIAFLDGQGRVIELVPALRPWRAAAVLGARTVIEFPEGRLGQSTVKQGDTLTWRPVGSVRSGQREAPDGRAVEP